MSEKEVRELLVSAEQFIRRQRAERVFETNRSYTLDGSHVIVGPDKPLAPDFVPSASATPQKIGR